MTIAAAYRFRLPGVRRRAPALGAGLGLLVAIALGVTRASPVSAQTPMPTMNPMISPFLSGTMFSQPMMQGQFYPSMYGLGMPTYGMVGSSYATSYAMPAAMTTYGSSNAYTTGPTTGYSSEPTYAYSGQYCTDKSGGQVWVPTGAPADDLNCNGATSSSTSNSGSGGGSGYSYPP